MPIRSFTLPGLAGLLPALPLVLSLLVGQSAFAKTSDHGATYADPAPGSTAPPLEGKTATWTSFELADGETLLDVITYDKDAYAITSQRVVRLGKRGGTVQTFPCPAAAASVLGADLVVGTSCGVLRSTLTGTAAAPLAGLDFAVDRVCLDYAGVVWAQDLRGRVFRHDHEDRTTRPVPKVSDVHDMAATPDGSTWFATSIGLYQLIQPQRSFGKTGNMGGKAGWYQHEEESRKGFELADNYVDQLYGHGEQVLWVQLDAALTYIDLGTAAAQSGHAHLPALSSLGPRDNRLRDATFSAKYQHALFATDVGVLALSKFEVDKISVRLHMQAGKELFGEPLSSGLRPVDLGDRVAGMPAGLIPRGVRIDGKGGMYVFGETGYAYLPKRAVAELLPAPDPAEYALFLQQQHVHFVTAPK